MILNLLKILHTGCSKKEATTLIPSRSIWNFKRKWLSYMHFGLIVANQNNKLNSGHYTVWKWYIQEVLHIDEGSDITSFSTQHPEFQEWVTFLQGIWPDIDKLKWIFKINKINKINQEKGFITLSTLKLLYTWCSAKEVMSLLLSWNT